MALAGDQIERTNFVRLHYYIIFWRDRDPEGRETLKGSLDHWRCAAEAFKPRPCLLQTLLISLPSLRQKTLLSDPHLFCFAYRIK